MARLHPTERLNGLTDGVVAVALTLLVIDVQLPERPTEAPPRWLQDTLLDMLPRIELWGASFLVVGVLWVIHHHIVGRQKWLDGWSFGLRLLFLGGVTLLPFSVSLVADHADNPLSLATFWGNVLLVGTVLAVQIRRILKLPSHLIHDDLRRDGGRLPTLIVTAVPVVAALSMALAYVHSRLSLWGWLPVMLVALWSLHEAEEDAQAERTTPQE